MPRIHFQQQLAALKDKLLAMAALSPAPSGYDLRSVDAYLQRDAGLCQYVREDETAINAAQREVDEMACMSCWPRNSRWPSICALSWR